MVKDKEVSFIEVNTLENYSNIKVFEVGLQGVININLEEALGLEKIKDVFI